MRVKFKNEGGLYASVKTVVGLRRKECALGRATQVTILGKLLTREIIEWGK